MRHAIPLALLLLTGSGPSVVKDQDPALSSVSCNARQFGAKGDGNSLDTRALQSAIDACAMRGGGTVHFPAGRYLSGTLELRSNVQLHLSAGATLLGSPRLEDYPVHVPRYRSYTDSYTMRSLLYAEGVKNAGLCGKGLVDGQGAALRGAYKLRPYLMRFVECQGVTLRDVRMRRSAMWTVHLLACDDVVVDGIDLVTLPQINHNNDGIDVDSSRRVRIANCHIRAQDDAIVLKSTSPRLCEDVTVTNCVLSSTCNAFKLGTESIGGFRDIAMSNCSIYDTRLAGIALELVDGGLFERICISNVTMRDVRGAAIFVRLGNRARPWWIPREGDPPDAAPPPPGMGRMRDISIANVQAHGVGKTGCAISGLPGHPIRNLTLANIRLRFRGGGTPEDAARLGIPEQEKAYPEFRMFGVLPAYGFYCRHVQNLRLGDVELSFEGEEARPPLVFEDIADLDLSGLWAQVGESADCLLRLRDVRGALIHGTRLQRPLARVVDADARCRDLRFAANAFDAPKSEARDD